MYSYYKYKYKKIQNNIKKIIIYYKNLKNIKNILIKY